MNTKPPASDAITQGAARGGLRSCRRRLVRRDGREGAARRPTARLRAGPSATPRLPCARRRCRVLAEEKLEALIEPAITARASYLEAIGGLGWLIRNHAVPNGDVRPHQLVRDADTPPSRWPEAAHADGGMAERLAALMEGDHP